MTCTGEGEIRSVYGRLPNNLGELALINFNSTWKSTNPWAIMTGLSLHTERTVKFTSWFCWESV